MFTLPRPAGSTKGELRLREDRRLLWGKWHAEEGQGLEAALLNLSEVLSLRQANCGGSKQLAIF